MNNDFQTSKKERISYGLYFLGQNIIWAYVGVASTFLLDIGIDAKVASAILLGPKIWDAINDTLFGFIVDKTKFKNKEKFLPWVKIGTALIGIAVILMYSIPASLANPSVKIAWFIVGYILMDLAYTMLDAPMYAMPTALTTNIKERTSLISSNRFCGILGAILATVLIPTIRPLTGWLLGAVIFVIFGLVFMVPFLFAGKERNTEVNQDKSYTFKEMFTYVKTNKYLTLSLLLIFVQGATSIEATLSLVMARNCFGNEAVASIITLITMLPTFLMSLFVPKLNRKFDKRTLILFGMICSFVGSILLLVCGYSSVGLLIVFMMLKGIGVSFFMILSYMLIADSVEYGTYKSSTRAVGISFSLQTFVAKLKNAIIGSVALFALGLFHYDSTLEETAVQSASVVKGIWTVYNLLPAIGALFCVIVLLFFYKLRDKDVEIMARCNNNEITRQEAESLLASKY
ncbi:MAG: MFS transporter [Erysipelotrichaceae bacterium]